MELLKLPQTAKELHLCETTVRRLARRGLISYRKLGRGVFFTKSDIEEFLEKSKIPAKQEAGK